jgi:predicted cytidylate kinase
MVISISGPAGSGTTTISKMIAAQFGLEHVYAGQMIRDMAADRGMSIYEFNEVVVQHPEIDHRVDDTIVEKAKQGDTLLEGRLSGWMMRHHQIPALKLYFIINPDIAAARVSERDGITIAEALERNADREERHWQRFKKLYDVDKDDLSIYDAVIDTSEKGIEEVFEEVCALVQEYYDSIQN